MRVVDSGSTERVVSGTDPVDFWTENQPGFRFSAFEPGTREFFEEVAAHRYSLEPAIKEMVRFDDWRGRDVLEAGCGIGTDAVEFARASARYTGLDFSPTALDLARRRFALEGLEARLVEGSVTALPFPERSFDLVYSNGVLHHVEDTQRAIREVHRVLRPGGTALVMLYHRDSLNYRVNIMIVRRALAALLVLPGAVRAVAMLTGESRDVIEGHRRLLAEHGLAYLRDLRLFLSSNTDGPGNVLSKVYSKDEGRDAFRAFSSVRADVRYLNLRLYPAGARLAATATGGRLERRYGWHLWLRAER
jgi:ubiquinone/menaquinone biosynthesis C-methylase UbiE